MVINKFGPNSSLFCSIHAYSTNYCTILVEFIRWIIILANTCVFVCDLVDLTPIVRCDESPCTDNFRVRRRRVKRVG